MHSDQGLISKPQLSNLFTLATQLRIGINSVDKTNIRFHYLLNGRSTTVTIETKPLIYLRAILQESEAKLEMKNFNPSSIFVCR